MVKALYRSQFLSALLTVLPCLLPSALPCVSGDDEVAPDPAARRAAMVAQIDEQIARRWAERQGKPSEPSSDAEFLRRVTLDLTGVIPRVAEVREFLADTDPNKRARAIDRLLATPRHATHQANLWRQILLPGGIEAEQAASALGVQNWLRDQFADNIRYDRLVSEFLVATDSNEAGPALFYTALELKPEKLASATARIFLGLQIECAQCHHHPFDKWRQEEFWGYAAFFARLRQPTQRGRNPMRIEDLPTGEVMLPGTQNTIAPAFPGGGSLSEGAGGSRREQLAIWMASRDNPYLARAAVNRVWAEMFGRGLVEPVDDLGPHNPPSHPELFEALTAYFVETGFDLRELHRTLAQTRTYQLSSIWIEEAQPAPELFLRLEPRPLTGDQLYDSIERLLGATPSNGMANRELGGFDPRRSAFLARLPAAGRSSTEYHAGVLQALQLMNGEETASVTNGDRSALVAALASPLFHHDERVEALFLATVGRLPAPDEAAPLLAHLEKAPELPVGLGDVLWALVNSAEFAFNH